MKIRLYDFDDPRFHVIGKCPDPVWPGRTMDEMWAHFVEQFKKLKGECGFAVYAFVLMSNHFHLLCSATGENEINELTDQLCVGVPSLSLKIVAIDHIEAYRNCYLYIYRNPVDAGLVPQAEAYRYSTLPFMLGRRSESLGFMCSDDMNLIVNPTRVLGALALEPRSFGIFPSRYGCLHSL